MRSVITWLHEECCSTSRDLKRAPFVWSVSDSEVLKALIPDEHLENESGNVFYRRKSSSSVDLSGTSNLDYYVRQQESNIDVHDTNGRVHYGVLPRIDDVLRNDAILTGHNRVAVVVRGSNYFRIDAVAACIEFSKELKISFDVHIERFEF
ncbi:hypothetical protein P3T76_006132 [Phytophthora citrophthora]|uniref:Uncharacterized protein n=1 Tax=Phytophthora citrophthora TaxID=4793 RepID=A0AAD9GR01_9STRA|nr:hypothetical protein P3T76_006132 [Phytophthora citrophthora]